MTYWDTSAIVPLYVEEPTSSFWATQLLRTATPAKSSILAITEFHYALRLKVHRGNLPDRSATALIAKFTEDCEAGKWELYPLGSDVITASLKAAKRSYAADDPVPLRSLDGLHLGAAITLNCDTMATGDQRLADAAERLNLKVLLRP